MRQRESGNATSNQSLCRHSEPIGRSPVSWATVIEVRSDLCADVTGRSRPSPTLPATGRTLPTPSTECLRSSLPAHSGRCGLAGGATVAVRGFVDRSQTIRRRRRSGGVGERAAGERRRILSARQVELTAFVAGRSDRRGDTQGVRRIPKLVRLGGAHDDRHASCLRYSTSGTETSQYSSNSAPIPVSSQPCLA